MTAYNSQMDSQSYEYWLAQGNYMPPHQTTVFELPPDMSKVPSLSGSPISATYDSFPVQIHQAYYPPIADEQMQFTSYALPMTPSDFGSDIDSPYCSPRQPSHAEPAFAHNTASSVSSDRPHATSGRRRAQNRAAQRAFRERKEKHARDLEAQLATLTEKYNKLEVSHTELNAAYEKLRKTIELLTQDDDAEGEDEDGNTIKRRSSSSDTLRKLLDILHGEFKGISVKTEAS